jgi:putative hydrolase of the HAD superfamily
LKRFKVLPAARRGQLNPAQQPSIINSKRKPAPVWLFDLDNTLHNASAVILPRVNRDMTDYVARALNLNEAAAQVVRKDYWHRYGATLRGMHLRHRIDPHDFLRETHRFPDMDQLVQFKPQLARWLRELPGKKILFTNAPHFYATQVIKSAGIARCFDALIAIEQMVFRGQWQPKPDRSMLRRALASLRIHAHSTWLIEDTVVNLQAAREVGVRGVWLKKMSYDRFHKSHRAGLGRKVSVQVQSLPNLKRINLG